MALYEGKLEAGYARDGERAKWREGTITQPVLRCERDQNEAPRIFRVEINCLVERVGECKTIWERYQNDESQSSGTKQLNARWLDFLNCCGTLFIVQAILDF